MKKKRGLFLCRTPFQAYLGLKIAKSEEFSEVDFIYITRNNGIKDKYYFDKIKQHSNNCYYLYHPEGKNFLTGYLKLAFSFPYWLLTTEYESIFIASINVWYFRAIAKYRKNTAKICTFDDGSGNFYKRGELLRKKTRLKDKLFNLPVIGMSVTEVLKLSVRHHTVNSKLPNIVDNEKLKQIPMRVKIEMVSTVTKTAKLFVGQNFHEYLGEENILRLAKFVSDLDCVYLKHPREENQDLETRSEIDVVETKKILEEYIEEILSDFYQVEVYGAFTTAFFTLNMDRVKKIYLSTDQNLQREEIMEKCGCEIRRI